MKNKRKKQLLKHICMMLEYFGPLTAKQISEQWVWKMAPSRAQLRATLPLHRELYLCIGKTRVAGMRKGSSYLSKLWENTAGGSLYAND